MRPPKPEPKICECGETAGVYWNGRWKRWLRCSRCETIWRTHGMSAQEYDEYMAQGCAVAGCTRPAVDLDHDHSICPFPRNRHSCDKCRRGPLCLHHNRLIIRVLDDLRDGKLTAELAYLARIPMPGAPS